MIARLLLRLSHALAAALWLGGAAYYFLALRPQLHHADEEVRAYARQAQQAFVEWASVATLVMIASGVVLMFDRLADGQGTATYAILLAVKVVAALIAFWMTGVFSRGRRSARRESARTATIDRAWWILGFGTAAFALGVVLSSVYPTEVARE